MDPRPAAGPWRITFVTNPDDCNLACGMCRDHSPLARRAPAAPRRLAFELVAGVLEERRGTGLREVVASTRGEPLLWPDLPRLARACEQAGLLLNVTTNGTFPGGAGAWAETLVPACSDLKISWGAATEATAAAVMPGRPLGPALERVESFLAVRDVHRAAGRRACRVTFQVTAEERNVAELPAVVRLARKLGVDRVKVNHLQVHFAELAPHDLRRTAASRARWNAAVAAMRREAGALSLEATPWPDDLADLPYGPCPFLGREAWITTDGRLAPCPAPAAQEGQLLDWGSIRDAPLGALWRAPAYRALVTGYAGREPCARCAFRRPGGA